MLEALFKLKQHNTTVKTELLAGLTTFITIAYIIFVNPQILGTTGMDKNAVFVATCLAAALGCLIMAFVANWPVGLAPGMGLNAYFAFTVVAHMGYSWQQALGAVFISGVLFILLTATGVRAWLIKGIPVSLRSAIVAGIGMFLALIAGESCGLVVENKATLVTIGDLTSYPVLLALLGFFLIAILDYYRIKAAILIGILSITLLSALLGLSEMPSQFVSMPPSIAPTFLQLDVLGVLNKGIINVILVFVLVEVFDATGVLIGVAKRANLMPEGQPNRLGKALFADSIAILGGSLLGTSSTTSYTESIAGAQAGGRTGLTAVVIAVLFLLALFFAPIASIIPPYATAPALLFVATLMLREFVEINWLESTESIPAVLTVLMMPFTYSIAEGIGIGFISYVILNVCTGKFKQIHPATICVAALFVLRYTLE
ncbi:NCS2 family permease [Brackiella oedipodis]|uniref:NCS2 family permease n=1 Tax=Brackiella oedipodis TaxID=124225 RepID=UPI000491D180|nr:NCS2 family permease [Brackiella oedipodis]